MSFPMHSQSMNITVYSCNSYIGLEIIYNSIILVLNDGDDCTLDVNVLSNTLQ